MATTISDIAQQAGVSKATVSLVLNNKTGVGSATREKILELAQKLGYTARKTNDVKESVAINTVRFLRIAKHGHIINQNHQAFIVDYIEGLEKEARYLDYKLEVSVFNHFDPEEILASLKADPVSGVIILATELDDTDLQSLHESPCPIVFIDSFHDFLPFDFVDMDNESSVYMVIEYLYQAGHRRIGLVKGSTETRNFQRRERSFHEAMRRFNLHCEASDVFSIDPLYGKGALDMKAQIQKCQSLPTALFCVNDIIAYSCSKALTDLGIAIPDQISLIGFDDLPPSAYMNPPLTSVKVSKRNIGGRAMQLIAEQIRTPARPSEKVLIGGKLIIRESVKEIDVIEGEPS